MNPEIKYKIVQGSDYVQEDWWKWWEFIECAEKDLDEIEWVLYKLHPTFNPPVIRSTDRSTRFKMETEGWGVFTIYATIHLKNGEKIDCQHELELFYPGGERNME